MLSITEYTQYREQKVPFLGCVWFHNTMCMGFGWGLVQIGGIGLRFKVGFGWIDGIDGWRSSSFISKAKIYIYFLCI